MLIHERYKDGNDAYQQLHSTYVEMDGELCHLTWVEGWAFSVRRVVEKFGQRVWGRAAAAESIKDADLVLEPIKLGYMNDFKNAVYVQRRPLRKWKQGIYVDYLEEVNPIEEQGKKQLYKRGQSNVMLRCFKASGFIDMYDNVFPTFVRAFTLVHLMGYYSQAWHRDWAFRAAPRDGSGNNNVCLDYKGKRVGEVSNGSVVLEAEYRYLTEAFVEAMIHAS